MCVLERNVDLILCIDGSSSMYNLINFLHNNISHLYEYLINEYENKGVEIKQFRIRIICFRNFVLDKQKAIFETKFFLLPEELSELETIVKSLVPEGGSPNENSGLEALAMAINSEWCRNLPRNRQIILLFSDTPPNKISSIGLNNPLFPSNIPLNFEELTDWWEDVNLDKIGSLSKRLILFAPDRSYWTDVGLNWSNTIHVPFVKYPFHLDSTTYPMDYIISTIVNSI